MKVVGLVSGGKDSCYNLMCCERDGHEVVALANLYPPPSGNAELDSYMYQSVGSDGIEFYGEACGLPLYRREISGRPLNQEAAYEKTVDDEVEDLYELLKEIKERHPDIEGVSAGAILSSYQKVRVEDVCRRLGLKALAYLWERNQLELLDEMIREGIDAILIKVAAIGLGPEHLGKTLKEMRDHLKALSDKWGVHICGEGGEYETFVRDCPLFKKGRIRVEDTETVIHSADAGATVAYLKLKKVVLEPK